MRVSENYNFLVERFINATLLNELKCAVEINGILALRLQNDLESADTFKRRGEFICQRNFQINRLPDFNAWLFDGVFIIINADGDERLNQIFATVIFNVKSRTPTDREQNAVAVRTPAFPVPDVDYVRTVRAS